MSYPLTKVKSNKSGGEITLEDKEVCNLSITCPTRCETIYDWFDACKFATIYSSTVALLPTHSRETNAVIARNRRIGVDIIDGAAWIEANGLHKVTRWLRDGYKIVRKINKWCAEEAGVPESIKVTCVKPGGTVSKLAGCVGGIGYPTFNYTKRRVRVAANAPIVNVLLDAKVPFELCVFDANTMIFEFAMYQEGTPATKVSLWQQAMNLVTFQREWADNAVSNTLYFKPKWNLFEFAENTDSRSDVIWYNETKTLKYVIENHHLMVYKYNENHEEDIIEQVIAHIVPLIKSCSFLPHSNMGAYKQIPEEGISQQQYDERPVYNFNWSLLVDSEGEDERYCNDGTLCSRT